MNLKNLFSDSERESINNAITEAESGTSAEILPIVTDASGGYDRGEDLFGLVTATVAVFLIWNLVQGADPTAPWSTPDQPKLHYGLPALLATIVVGFIAGAFVASKVWAIRYMLTPRREMETNLVHGAQRAFQLHRVGGTRGATGVLIYISLFERMVHVIGDNTIREKLQDQDFVDVKDVIVKGFASGKGPEGLADGIRLCGTRLSEHFPIGADDQNELPNELVLFEQGL